MYPGTMFVKIILIIDWQCGNMNSILRDGMYCAEAKNMKFIHRRYAHDVRENTTSSDFKFVSIQYRIQEFGEKLHTRLWN